MYDRKIEGRELTFGVSGRLYQSNVLLYDKQTESLWSQLKEEAVTGEMTGTKLRPLPSVMTTWGRWRKLHAKTIVLSPDTGHRRPYDRNPYEDYERSPDIMFPPSRVDRRLPPKERILGLEVEGEELAISFRSLAGQDQPLRLRLAEVPVEIRYDQASETAEALVDGKPFPAFTGYWFAWYGFHPKTKVWGESDETSTSLADDPSMTIVDHEGGWGDLTGVGPGGEIADAGSFYLISGTLRKLADSTVAAATGGNLGPADGHDLPGEDLDRVSVGEAAPDFLLEDHRGERVRLSQFRGERPVVLVFYRGKW